MACKILSVVKSTKVMEDNVRSLISNYPDGSLLVHDDDRISTTG